MADWSIEDPSKLEGGWKVEDVDKPTEETFQTKVDKFGKKYIRPIANTITLGALDNVDSAFDRFSKPGLDNKIGGVADLAGGAVKSIGPGLVGRGLVAASAAGKVLPYVGHTIAGLAAGTATGIAGRKAAELAGAGPGVQDAAELVAGMVPATAIAGRAYRKAFASKAALPEPVTVTSSENGPVEGPKTNVEDLSSQPIVKPTPSPNEQLGFRIAGDERPAPKQPNLVKGWAGKKLEQVNKDLEFNQAELAKLQAQANAGQAPGVDGVDPKVAFNKQRIKVAKLDSVKKRLEVAASLENVKPEVVEPEAPVGATPPGQEELFSNAFNPNEEALPPTQPPDHVKDYYLKLKKISTQPGFKELPDTQQKEITDSINQLKSSLPGTTRRELNRLLSTKSTPPTEDVTVTDNGGGGGLKSTVKGSPAGANALEDLNNQFNTDQKAIEEAGKGRLGTSGKFMKNAVDSFHMLESMLGKYYHTLEPGKNATDMVDDTLRSDVMGNAEYQKNIGELTQSIFKSPEELRAGSQYILNKRLVDLFDRGLLSKFPASRDIEGIPGSGYERAKKNIAEIEATHPQMKEFSQKYTEYANKLLGMLKDNGIISPEVYNDSIAKHSEYAILRRVFDGEGVVNPSFQEAPGSVNRQNIIKELEHGGKEVAFEDPLGLLLNRSRQVYKIINRNKLAKQIAEYGGVFGEGEGKVVLPEFKDIIKVVEKPKSSQDAVDEISFLQNGKRVVIKTLPELASALKLLEKSQGDKALDILSKVIRVSKAGITGANPVFAATNFVADQSGAMVNMEGGAKGVLEHFKAFPKAFMSVLTRNNDYDLMSGRGALGTSYDILKGPPTDSVERLWADHNLGRKQIWFYDLLKHPTQSRKEGLKTIGEEVFRMFENRIAMTEEITRAQQWYAAKKMAIDKGLPEDKAMTLADRAARWNTANFLRTGDAGRGMNALFLYMNAAKEGTRSWLRAAKHNPAAFTTKASLLIGAPVAYFTYNNLSSDRNRYVYNDIPEEVKTNSLVWITPWAEKGKDGRWDGVYLIPVLRHGVGQMASVLRHGMEDYIAKEGHKGLEYVGDVARALVPLEWSNATLHATAPLVEAFAYNKNAFTGREIEPRSEANKPLVERTSKKTTNLATDITKGLNKVHIPLSPPKVQHIAEGYAGRFFPGAAAWGYDRLKGVPPKEGREDWLRGTATAPFYAPYGGNTLRKYKAKADEARDFKDSIF
jgi:hypothetical protein